MILQLFTFSLTEAAAILHKAFERRAFSMRRSVVSLSFGFVILGALALPDAALARENEQPETASCPDSKHRSIQVRPLTESLPIRKLDKVRVRRILM